MNGSTLVPLGDSIKGNECTLLINSSLDSADDVILSGNGADLN